MIDIHCHIIPGIDDGPKTMAESIELARAAVHEGVHTIIATPHWNAVFENEAKAILRLTAELQEALDHKEIPLTVLPGQEPRIAGEMVMLLENEVLLPLTGAGSYIFVEFPFDGVPRYAKQLFYDLQLAGFVPVIVHPERNVTLREHHSILYDFVCSGALTQVTAASLTGRFGKKVQIYSRQLIEANQCHFLASDAHDTVKRGFHMKEAEALIQTDWGQVKVDQLRSHAQAVVMQQTIYPEAPKAIKKKKWLGLF